MKRRLDPWHKDLGLLWAVPTACPSRPRLHGGIDTEARGRRPRRRATRRRLTTIRGGRRGRPKARLLTRTMDHLMARLRGALVVRETAMAHRLAGIRRLDQPPTHQINGRELTIRLV